MLQPAACLISLALLLVFLVPANAQTTFSTLTGRVSDGAGAPILGASIEVTQLETNYKYDTESNDVGVYSLPQLREGTYTLRVRVQGFKEFLATNIKLSARDIRRVDANLQVGAVETTVEVNAATTLIESETARISQVASGDVFRYMPLNSRQFGDYLNQIPGVIGVDGLHPRVGGAQSSQSMASADGIAIGLPRNGASFVGPTGQFVETVQEMRVDLSNNSAEYGYVGAVNMITKSGTNKFHGKAFDYYKSGGLSARNPFAPVSTSSVEHDLGISLGGPVVIPRVYKGKDKTFFYFLYETYKGSAIRQLLNPSVPLQSWRGGDFSGLAAVRDPLTGQPFPGNRIPSARINATSQKIQDRFWPLANFGDTTTFASQNYREVKERPYDPFRLWSLRADHRFSSKSFIYGRVNNTDADVSPYQSNLPTVGQADQKRFSTTLLVSHSYVFRNNLMNEFRYGALYHELPIYPPGNGKQIVQDLGLVGLVDNLPDYAGLPRINFTGLGITGIGLNNEYRVPGRRDTTIQFQDHLSWFHGRHSVKMGTMIWRETLTDMSSPTNLFGNINFSNRFTGHPYGDFLLGIPTTVNRAYSIPVQDVRFWMYDFFITDDLKLTPKLTVNLGLRYENHRSEYESQGLQSAFDIATGKIVVPDGSLNKVSPLMPKGYVDIISATQAGWPQTLRKTGNRDFAPRFGMAYRPWGARTVLRAGWGLYYDPAPDKVTIAGVPYVLSEPAFTNPANAPTVIFPRVFPAGSAGGVTTVSLPTAGRLDMLRPYTMQHNATIEHQRWNNAFRLSYIGTIMRQGVWQYDINQPLPSAKPYIDKPRPWPNYPGVIYRTNGGYHAYHSMTTEVRRPMSHGLSYQFAWVWARDIEDADPENAYDRRREVGVSSLIPTHRITSNFIYQLPFGKNRTFFRSAGRLVDSLFGGWELSGIFTTQTGQFLTPSWSGPDPTGTRFTTSGTAPTVTIRPNHLHDANLPADEQSRYRWFDPTAFAPPSPGQFGTAARGVIIGTPINTWHAGLFKYFALTDRVNARFEATSTNVFNHVNLQNPNTNISSAGDVGVINNVRGNQDSNKAYPRQVRLALSLEW